MCVLDDFYILDMDNCYFHSIDTTQKQSTSEIQLLPEESSYIFLINFITSEEK